MKFCGRAVATCFNAVQKIVWVVLQFALYKAGAICLGGASTCLWDLCEVKAGGRVRVRMSGCLSVCVRAWVSLRVCASACVFDSASVCACVCVSLCVCVLSFVCLFFVVRVSPPKLQGIRSHNISTLGAGALPGVSCQRRCPQGGV